MRAVNIWKEMKPASLRRLALAAFLLFSAVGLITILAESELRPHPWSFVCVQTAACGGMAASFLLFPRKRWWASFLIIAFWCAVLVMNSGGLSFVYNEDGFRVRLGSDIGATDVKTVVRHPEAPLLLTPVELDAIYVQRGIVGTAAMGFLVVGYMAFIRVFRMEARERARLEAEVAIAREIQQSLLPRSEVNASWCRVSGLTLPMTEVGCDYFDVMQLPGEMIAVAVADVTGHGVGAGILSAMTKSAFHSELGHDPSPDRVLRNINRTLFRLSDRKTFVTFAYLLLERSGGRSTVSTAGHPPVLHRNGRTGNVIEIRTAALGLGMQEDTLFTSAEIPSAPGDAYLLYTDGALELANRYGEQFGIERLIRCFESLHGEPEEICAGIISELRAFSDNEEFRDDVTLVCVTVSGS
jgi:serine phosphatase RsbU (regulator of sigma subunit)